MLAEQPQGHVTTPIMPARPLCFGRGKRDTPACSECRVSWWSECAMAHWGVMPAALDAPLALIRVYARENRELRERVEALEWLREVEDYTPSRDHPACEKEGLGNRCGEIYDDAVGEYVAIRAHARKEASV